MATLEDIEETGISTRRALLAAGTAFVLAAACNKDETTATGELGDPPDVLSFSEESQADLPELQPRSDEAWSGEEDDTVYTVPEGWDPFTKKDGGASPSPESTPTTAPTPRDAPPLQGADPNAEPSPFPTSTPLSQNQPAPTATTAPTATAQPTATATAQPTATAVAPTATPTAVTPTATPLPTATPDPGATATPTVDPAATPTSTVAPTATPTATQTPTPTATQTPTPTATQTPTPTATATPTPTAAPVTQSTFGQLLAQRASFGPTVGLMNDIAATTPENWIEAQLDHTNLDDSVIEGVLAGYATLTNTNAQNWAVITGDNGQTRVFGEVMHATFLRAVYSPKQLYEMMCDFWFNHLNVHMFGGYSFRHLTAPYLRDVIRPHALGRFTDMLQASAVSPTMLTYLDNWRSNANSSAGVNENYGRELLELHTLGIRDGAQVYDEVDVRQASYVFSGWSIDTSNDQDVFWFRQNYHWREAISILGGAWTRPDRTGADDATLIADGVSLLNFLAVHRSTAEYICWKLCVRFVSDDPPEALVQRLADEWQATGTDITAVMRMLLNSDEFKASAGQKVRRGLETVASYFRTLGANVDTNPVGDASETINSLSWYEGVLERHGQRLFSKATPDGYADTGEEWVSSDGMLRRWETAGLLARNDLADGVVVDASSHVPNPLPPTMGEVIDAMVLNLTGTEVTATERAVYATFLGVAENETSANSPLGDANLLADFLGLVLSRPSFQYR